MPENDLNALRRVVPAVHWITEEIAITNIVSANDASILAHAGIATKAILCLDRNSQERYGHDDRRIAALVDGENPLEDFTRAVDALADMLRHHRKVLVHCHAGRSRSLVVVAGYLVRHLDFTAEAALELVTERRPCASIMPGLLKNLRNLPKK